MVLLLSAFSSISTFAQYESAAEQELDSLYINGSYQQVILHTSSFQKSGTILSPDAWKTAAKAAYVLNKTIKQQYYLQQALNDNPFDSAALVHLYYCQLQNKNYTHAQSLLHHIRKHELLNPAYELPNQMLSVAAGTKNSSSSLYQPLYFGELNISAPVGKLSSFHAIGYLTQNTHFGDISQFYYYGNLGIALPHNFAVTPAIQMAQYHISNYPVEYTGNPLLKSTSWVLGVEVRKQIRSLQLTLSPQRTDINQQIQYQYNLGATWFASGNTNFVISAQASYLSAPKLMVPSFSSSVKLHKRVQLWGSWLYAHTTNFTEQNGLILNNTFDVTKTKWATGTSILLSPKVVVEFIFQQERKTEEISQTDYLLHLFMIKTKTAF